MTVLDISRFTLASQSRALWSHCRDGLKFLAQSLFGLACFIFLSLMHKCEPRNTAKDDGSEEASSRNETGDLESQAEHAAGVSEPERSRSEGTRGDNRSSRADGNERLSIVKRTHKIRLPDTPSPADTDDGTSSKASDKKPDPVPPIDTGASDDRDIVITPRKIELRTTYESGGTNARNEQDSISATPARQQLLGASPKRLAVDTAQAEADKVASAVRAEHEAERRDYNVSSTQHAQKSDANSITRGSNDENRVSQSTTTITFDSETARYFFLNRTDAYAEKEVVGWTTSLNSRINSLSAHLINGLVRASSDSKHEAGDKQLVLELVQNCLGPRLYTELVDARRISSTDDASATIHDSLDTWLTSCIHLAMTPMLFGFSLRTVENIEEILRQMSNQEPDLAQCWKQIRRINPPRTYDQGIQTLAHDICPLQHAASEDMRSYCILEHIYQRDLITEAGQGRQVAMHWRALLHKHELGLASYAAAIIRTEDVLSRGILHIFAIAGFTSPKPESFRDKVEKIVKEAATLAERVKTGVFSQTIETVVVEPGSSFDKNRMKPAEEGGSNEVKCTIQLGLHGSDPDGQEKYLIAPEVLLV